MTGLQNWEGRVVVVTGGASGIGLGLVKAFRARGAHVVVADIEQAPLDAVIAELGVTGFRVDVTDAAAVEQLAGDVIERFGRVDVLCNNAGVSILRPVADFTLDDFSWMLSINTWGVIHGLKSFLPHLIANPAGGWVVNTSSMAALIPTSGMSSYVLSKSGVGDLTDVLTDELEGTGVGASTLYPALVRSNIATGQRNRPGFDPSALDEGMNDDHLPPGRMLEADDVGDLVVEAIERGDRYIITHPELLPAVEARHENIQRAFREAAERESARRTA